jgi:hypothetical protein
MRIVHEIYSNAIVVSQGEPLVGVPANNFVVTLTIVTPAKGPSAADDLHIEGDAKLVRAALERALASLDATAAGLIRDGKLAADWHGAAAREGANTLLIPHD